jgi:hypothetical protein
LYSTIQALKGLLEPTLVGQPSLPVLMQEDASMDTEPISRTITISFFISKDFGSVKVNQLGLKMIFKACFLFCFK